MKKYGLIILIAFLVHSCASNKTLDVLNSKKEVPMEIEMEGFIQVLIADSIQHEEVGPKLTDLEIQNVEIDLGLTLPPSYRYFLKHFGNGAYFIYGNSIDDINNFSYLSEYRKELGKTIKLVGEKKLDVNSLLSLMTEDSNGGAWVWLTSENSENGEWPLAYYSMSDKKLYYKVENFTEWLRILVKTKYEVIRELDVEEKLMLG